MGCRAKCPEVTSPFTRSSTTGAGSAGCNWQAVNPPLLFDNSINKISNTIIVPDDKVLRLTPIDVVDEVYIDIVIFKLLNTPTVHDTCGNCIIPCNITIPTFAVTPLRKNNKLVTLSSSNTDVTLPGGKAYRFRYTTSNEPQIAYSIMEV